MKTAIVIGATSGIGKELALLLANNQYKVGITGRRIELLNELKVSNPDSFVIQPFDVINTQLAIDKLQELVTKLGGLDLLIFSSGIGDINETLNFEVERKVIDVNVTGFTNIVDWTYNYFQKQGFGHLVAISSIAGIRGSGKAPSYNATKAYQINYLEGLRQKSAKSKSIFVTDIRPGLVDTAMAKGEGLFWVMPVEKVVKQMFNAIRQKRKVVYITKRWGFMAFLLKLIPRFLYEKL